MGCFHCVPPHHWSELNAHPWLDGQLKLPISLPIGCSGFDWFVINSSYWPVEQDGWRHAFVLLTHYPTELSLKGEAADINTGPCSYPTLPPSQYRHTLVHEPSGSAWLIPEKLQPPEKVLTTNKDNRNLVFRGPDLCVCVCVNVLNVQIVWRNVSKALITLEFPGLYCITRMYDFGRSLCVCLCCVKSVEALPQTGGHMAHWYLPHWRSRLLHPGAEKKEVETNRCLR